MTRLKLVFAFALVVLLNGVAAQETTPYPTLTALESTTIPAADRVDLARRLRGVTDIPSVPTTPPVYQVGARELLWAQDIDNDRTFQVDAVLRAIGEHVYVWIDSTSRVTDAEAFTLASNFDTQIYDQVRELWGTEASPGIDGDPRLHILAAHRLGNGVAAYFASRHTYPAEVVTASNEREMFFINLDAVGEGGLTTFTSILAHEFQHMIRRNLDDDEETWLDEGFSTFTELYLGFEDNLWMPGSYFNNPQTQLNSWRTGDVPTSAHYGASMLFLTYLYDRYGIDALNALSAEPLDGLAGVDRILRLYWNVDVDTFFTDWVVANLLRDDPTYGYTLLPPGRGATVQGIVRNYPVRIDGSAYQYSATYYTLNDADADITISVSAPEAVRLVPADAYSGEWVWYSNRSDDMDTTLTRTFDLTGVDSATLTYRLWYDIEEGWDYGYVMVSTDDGATWTPLATAHTTDFNPHNNAYGAGYTGVSDGWVDERVSLDAYAGQPVQVRFEVITDSAVVMPGMMIDDIAVPEIGYFSDLEMDGGGWEAAGWIRMDNRLPQSYWLQVVQESAENIVISRWQGQGDGTWTIPATGGTLILSPLAPVTTEPMPYSLEVRSGN